MIQDHVPVLFNESLEYLVKNRSGIYFDATMGFGGHSRGILKMVDNNAKLIATDLDSAAFEHSRKKFLNDARVKIYNYNFKKIDIIAKIESVAAFDGIIADLGVSSYQLDTPEEGFSYRSSSFLDLRMDKTLPITAAHVVNTFDEKELSNLIFNFGEEKNSRKIAARICKERDKKRIETTDDLARIISDLTAVKFRNKSLSRVFQALRIYVNDELNSLREFILKSVELLKKGGRIVILSYHSLEDRIVKEAFRYESLSCICPKDYPVCKCNKVSRLKILTKRPILPSADEIRANYRSRSAKMRVAERI